MQWLQLTRTRDTHHVHYRSLGLVMQERRLGSWITHAESMQWAWNKVAMLYEEFLAYRDICCISTLYSHKSNNHAKNTIFIKTYMCVCVHSLRTPAIRISRIESIEWNVLQCSMSPPQTISMILDLSILSLKMIQRFLCHFWCLASQNLAPIWLPHWPPWIETSSRMAEIESKSERGDWEIGLCQKENTCVTTYRATYKSHTSNTCNTLAMKSRKYSYILLE